MPASAPAASSGEAIAALEAMRGAPDGVLIHEASALLGRYPHEQYAMFEWLHRHRGNGVVQHVISEARATGAHDKSIHIDYNAGTPDWPMWLDQLLSFGEVVGGETVGEMVDAIIAKAGGNTIGSLDIHSHGSEASLKLTAKGTNVDAASLATYAPELARLTTHFEPGAVVTLHGCNVSGGPQGEQFLRQLAALWQVKVRAGRTYQNSFLGLEGSVTTAVPTDEGTAIAVDDGFANEFMWGLDSNDAKAREHFNKFVETNGTAAPVAVHPAYWVVRNLVGGRVTDEEAATILQVFRQVVDPRALYAQLESHPWNGDFVQGWFTDDDGLYNALSDDQLDELRAILNR